MVEGLLLDGIDAEPARAPVGREDDGIVLSRPYEAHPALSFLELAEPGADVALHPSVLETVPVPRGDYGGDLTHHLSTEL